MEDKNESSVLIDLENKTIEKLVIKKKKLKVWKM